MAISKPSKSATKREYLTLQQLGEDLIDLADAELKSIGLETDLLEVILDAKSMRSHGALRRQKQLIGKLMRGQDPAPIRAALQKLGRNEQLQKEVFRKAEHWRDRIALEGSGALQEFFTGLGFENEELASLLQIYLVAHDDKRKRALGRKIFREIYNDLTVKMQNDAL
jgi:ribosome-associated protein